MNNVKILLLLLAVSMSSMKHSCAQERDYDVTELKIGDQCPDFKFDKIFNYSKSTAQLSDFKGKLVILDFWRTWCSPCVAGLPKMDSLEKKFKERLIILPVTSEKEDVVGNFIGRNKILKALNIKTLLEDQELFKFFRHTEIPHEVWIDGTGKVIAITGAKEVNEAKIQEYLNGQQVTFEAKKDLIDYNYYKPFFFGGFPNGADNLLNDKLISSSTLMHSVDGLPGIGGGPSIIGDKAIIRCVNVYPEIMYGVAFGTVPWRAKTWDEFDYSLRFHNSRVLWEAKKVKRERFLYELVLPKKDSLQMNNFMINDLNRFFGSLYGIKGVLEKRRVKCWILKRTSNKDPFKAKHLTDHVGISDRFGNVNVTNMKVKQFLYVWNMELSLFKTPLVDETGYTDDIDLKLDVKIKDFDAVKKAIFSYDLEFVFEERTLDMIVIKELSN